jgi:DNA modification methylase
MRQEVLFRDKNFLFNGDNLDILRYRIASDSVDLVYLDPPFNSNKDYSIIFKEQDEEGGSEAQIKAFGDTWKWGPTARDSYRDAIENGSEALVDVMEAFRTFLGPNHMLAYLSMMAPRLMELHRVLKPTGSIFLHCDPTASHYLKLLMDAIFGPTNFRNEIVWCYTGPGSPGIKQFLRKHDVVFWYSMSKTWTFNADDVRIPHSEKTKANYKSGLKGSGFVGAEHLIHKSGKVPEDWWRMAIAPRGREYRGYPTQKPKALFARSRFPMSFLHQRP